MTVKTPYISVRILGVDPSGSLDDNYDTCGILFQKESSLFLHYYYVKNYLQADSYIDNLGKFITIKCSMFKLFEFETKTKNSIMGYSNGQLRKSLGIDLPTHTTSMEIWGYSNLHAGQCVLVRAFPNYIHDCTRM